ncbi:MAG: hypothetical protein QXO47_07040 [Thermoproteota archaeon]
MGARERFIESIEYLRKMGFFEEYCNLSSEEIFEKIRENSIALKYLGVKEVEERWMKESVYEVDSFIAIFDKRRVLGKDVEVVGPEKGLSTEIFKEIVRISRGVFQPTDIEEEWLGHNARIHFTFRGKRHVIDFCFYTDLLQINPIMRRINSLIEDTGYQYYELLDGNQTFFAVVLTREEAEKLIRERGWKISCKWG